MTKLALSVLAIVALAGAPMRAAAADADFDRDGLADKVDPCPTSNVGGTLVINRCDTGVPNRSFNGCTLSDLVEECAASAPTHGRFLNCVANLVASELSPRGLGSSGRWQEAIMRCATRANVP